MPFTNTSTVEGSTASPLAESSGVVTNEGCVLKLVPYWMPAKRAERPQEPADEIESPTRSVSMRSGKSRVQAVSRRTPSDWSGPVRATAEAVTTPLEPKMPTSTKVPALASPETRWAETS